MKKLTPQTSCENPVVNPALYQEKEIDILARTLWGEARGEGTHGMHAVACTIMNRVTASKKRGGFWWGNDIISVCQKPYQFSCLNKNDPNHQKLKAVQITDPYFASAVATARRAVYGVLDDITQGANHYHARSILPSWAQNQTPCAVIGHHLFYKL